MPPGCCWVVWPKGLGVVLEGWLEPNKDPCGFEPNIDEALPSYQHTSARFSE